MSRKVVRTVVYTEVEAVYFERRQLRRYARVGSLWALGVGAVIVHSAALAPPAHRPSLP